jgi:hypothetical protein
MLMERVAEVIRGWPYDGSLDMSETITTGATLRNGDWVTKQADGTVNKTGASGSALAGLVIEGNGDASSAANSNRAVVLWSNFIAKIANYGAGSFTPGTMVTAKNGVLVPGVPGTDPVNGYVTEVIAAATGLDPETAHITIVKAF